MEIVEGFEPPYRTLVIGDVHGNYDRLEALLTQEGIIGECTTCKGTGDHHSEGVPSHHGLCGFCWGEGIARIDHDSNVIQLGDLGHFGRARNGGPGSPTGDLLCWKAAQKGWIDVILWGNHDYACVNECLHFGGFMKPRPEVYDIFRSMTDEGRLVLSKESHGFLLTHAGLHASVKHNRIDPELKTDPLKFSQWINQHYDVDYGPDDPKEHKEAGAIITAIGGSRGGSSPAGGILWRDANENLYKDFRQIFGHTARDKVRTYQTKTGDSYCIDIGSEDNGKLAGMWLPDEKVVEVQL